MASLRLLCLLLVLSAAARGQEAEVAGQNVVPEAGNQPVAENPEQPPLLVAEVPEQPTIPAVDVPEQPSVPVVDVPEPVAPSSIPEVTEKSVETDVAAPVNETESDVEDPKIAAKQIEGSSELDKPLIFELDTIKKALGANCIVSNDCAAIKDTDCIDGSCLCKTGFIPSKHSLVKCLKVPTGLGDECEEEAQCRHAVPDSECRNNKCECPPNYVFAEDRCWEKQMLGGDCNITLQCNDVTFATCAQGVCTCDSTLIPSPDNKCLQPAGNVYKAACVEDIQCTHSYGDEARCSNNQCRCTNNYHFNGTTCITDKKLGEACMTDEECTVAEINNVEESRMCVNSTCSCATGYSTLPGEEICTKSSGEELAVSLTWVLCIVVAKYYLA